MTRTGEAARMVPIGVVSLAGAMLSWLPDGRYLLFAVNLVALAAGLAAMHWRRRHPVVITLALGVLMIPLPVLTLLGGWAYVSLATHMRIRTTVWVGAVLVGLSAIAAGLVDAEEAGVSGMLTVLVVLVLSLFYTVALGAIGSTIGSRRREREAVREKLALAERERELANEQARAEERDRIAREMHDVLAHKITLISLHAGALAYRDDLTDEQVRDAGATIHSSSQAALAELRTILGQLRQTDDGAPAKPQPTLEMLEELVAGHRAAGHRVEVHGTLDGAPREAVGRHAYRIVQEGLTNAVRHAPGSVVRVTVDGNADDGVNLRVENPLSVVQSKSPGAGVGLVGLRERVELMGGTLTAGPVGGQFVLEAWLPW